MSYYVLPLTSVGGYAQSFNLGSTDNPALTKFVVKYNYTTSIWNADLFDASDNLLLSGLALIPGHDLLARFPELQSTLGSLVLIELYPGDYTLSNQLGMNTQLLWFPVGEPVVIPT